MPFRGTRDVQRCVALEKIFSRKPAERIILKIIFTSFLPLFSYLSSLRFSLSLSLRFFLLLSFWLGKVGRRWETRSTNETTESYFTRLFLPTCLYHVGDSSEGVLTWDAMTLSAFQKYDRTLARRTAPGEFSGCLHRWRSCCECH